jgi:hypothetical protein
MLKMWFSDFSHKHWHAWRSNVWMESCKFVSDHISLFSPLFVISIYVFRFNYSRISNLFIYKNLWNQSCWGDLIHFFFQKGGKSVSNKSKLRIKENHPPVFGWQLHVVNLCIIIGAKNIAKMKMLKMHFVTKRLRRKMVDACNLNHPDGSNKSRNKMPGCKTRFWTFGRKTRTLTNN